MSEKKSKVKLGLSKKKAFSIITTAVILLLACGAGILISWLQRANNSGSNISQNGSNNISGLPTSPLPSSVIKAQALEAQQNYDQAQKSISDSLAKSTSSDEKYELYLEQGVTYENQQQYDNAIAAYNNAKLIKETPPVYEAIARVAGDLGNKQLEIDSLTKAIAVMDMSKPRSAGDKQQLENQIKELSQ